MSEILTLAKTFKQRSDKEAESINNQVDSVITSLNDSMTAKLQESENIIKDATTNLDEQNGQLQLMLQQHQDNTRTALSSYTKEVQALTRQALKEHTEQMQIEIESYGQNMQELIEQNQAQTYQRIKSDTNKWAIIAGVTMFTILIIGLLMGLFIAKKVIKPTIIYYEQPAKTQTYNPK